MRRAIFLALVACKSKRDMRHDVPMPEPPPEPVIVADARVSDAPAPWPELADRPLVEPTFIVAIPTKSDAPRFETAGPAIVGDLAIVASSQFGFAAVDWRRGQIAWTKPSGPHVAPPIAVDGTAVLIGSCVNPPDAPDLLGCLRVVTPAGADQANLAIRGTAPAFAASTGTQEVWRDGEHAVRWRRGDAAISIDLPSGAAKPASAKPPPVIVTYRGKQWSIEHTEDGKIVATGRPPWKTERAYTEMLGAVYLPDQAPMLRVANRGAYHGNPEIMLMDMDATGSLHGQVAFPVPGIAITSHAISSVGDVAMAIRLDASLERDYVVGYAASSLLMWVYPLPVMARPDPVGVAVAPEAVVVFHDGDTVTILPELSAPPTAPGAVRAPSQNPTP